MAVRGSIWSTLGIAPTNAVDDIRRAYARRLKQVHPEDDPEGFQTLRAAYEQASNMARRGWAAPTVGTSSASHDDDDDYADDDVFMEHGGHTWSARPENRGGSHAPEHDDWSPRQDNQWERPSDVEPQPHDGLHDDIRQELAGQQARSQAHAALCDALVDQVQSPAASPEACLTALMAVFRSPAMAAMDVHGRTEYWLAHLLTAGPPSVEPLFEPAIQFFGWNDRRIGVDLGHALPVLDRVRSMHAVRAIGRPGSEHHEAFKTLQARQTVWTRIQNGIRPGLDLKVRRLLTRIDHDVPGLAADLSPPALETWRKRLSHPGFSNLAWLLLLIVPPVLGMVASLSTLFGPPRLDLFLTAWVLSACIGGLGGLAWIWCVAWPSRLWVGGHPWTQPLWIRLGWAPLAAAFLILSGFLPVSVPWVAAYWLLLGPLALWAVVTNAHLERARPGLLAALPVLAWLVVHAHGPQFVSLCWAASGVTVVAHRGLPALQDTWFRLSSERRRLLATGLALTAVLAMAAVALAPTWPTRAMAAALLTLVVLAARPIRLCQPLPADLLWSRWSLFGWIPCVVLVWFIPTKVMAEATFVAAGVWLTIGVLITALWEASPRLEALLSPKRKAQRKRRV